MLICGRYEGVDQRIIDRYVDIELCIGDYVLSSGEVAALACIDAVYRLCSGIIRTESLDEESFQNGLLEYPHYTRPEEFMGMRVPEVLLSGHHAMIKQWRLEKSIEKTAENRRDLLEGALMMIRSSYTVLTHALIGRSMDRTSSPPGTDHSRIAS